MSEPNTREILDALLSFREAVEMKFDQVDRRFDGMDRRIDRVDDQLDRVERRITSLEGTLERRGR